MSRIVISYRRDDSADVTGRIYDYLKRAAATGESVGEVFELSQQSS